MNARSQCSSSESEVEGVDASIKILINDVTPCDSREFLHLSSSQSPLLPRSQKRTTKAPLQRRASWTYSARKSEEKAKVQRCWSHSELGAQDASSVSNDLLFRSRLSNNKEGSEDSIPEGIREKQRSFSAGSREDVFMFCNQFQESAQSMSDMLSGDQSPENIQPKTVKKHSLVTLGRKNSRKEEWLIAPRSTLQKSVSTPSIVAAQEIQEIANRRDGRDRNLLKTGAQENEDEKSFSKRKKRGSLFFRKKKNKDKDKKNSSHQFVSICFSTAATCDVCNRGLANKSALKCENCSVTVHDSSCKDHVPHCAQSKTLLSTLDKDSSSSLLIPSGKHSQPSKEKKSSLTDITRINITSSETVKVSPPSSNNVPRKNYSPSGYSQWRRVATKLGVNKVICEEKEVEVVEDINSNIYETNSASMESLEDGNQGTSDVEDDTMLQLLDDEPETWNGTVDKKVLKKLKERDVKRQEAIYELILTEKHHCLTLKVMQRVFAKGMLQELSHTRDFVHRLFPHLEQLLRYHLNFLQRLRERQRQESLVSHVGDVLLQQFEGQNADDLCTYYSQFCSQHKEALSLYKDIHKTDRKFQSFVKRCATKPFCKARGIPECILLVTQRLTKYPLLIDALLKTTKENKVEIDMLNRAYINIKDIVEQVNSAVAEKDREARLLEIYNRIDAKSTAFYRRKKFKKSDLLSDNRKLRYEGILDWKSARGKVIDVHVIILSDVIVLLQENNQKFTFASLDNKAAVISLPKLLVREKAGQNSGGLYLISSNPSDPEMYEMLASSPRDKKKWLHILRDSVAMATNESSSHIGNGVDGGSAVEDENVSKLADLCATLQEKDAEIVTLCEEKIRTVHNVLELLGFDKQKLPSVDLQQFLQKDEEETERLLLYNLNQASNLASRMQFFDSNPFGNSVDCSTSTSMSPILPKRAETFAGFDTTARDQPDKVSILKRKLMQLKEMDVDGQGDKELSSSDSNLHIKPKSDSVSNLKFISNLKSPELMSSVSTCSSSHGGYNRVEEVAELNHLLANVTSLLHHHLSIYRKEHGKRRYRPDHQLEELRNIQEKLSQERLHWEQERSRQEKELEKKKQELLHLQKRLSGEFSVVETNKLSCSDNRLCDCPSPGLCRHKRSASFDFRTATPQHDLCGRQSWSGPIDDDSLLLHQQFVRSTSNLHHLISEPAHRTEQKTGGSTTCPPLENSRFFVDDAQICSTRKSSSCSGEDCSELQRKASSSGKDATESFRKASSSGRDDALLSKDWSRKASSSGLDDNTLSLDGSRKASSYGRDDATQPLDSSRKNSCSGLDDAILSMDASRKASSFGNDPLQTMNCPRKASSSGKEGAKQSVDASSRKSSNSGDIKLFIKSSEPVVRKMSVRHLLGSRSKKSDSPDRRAGQCLCPTLQNGVSKKGKSACKCRDSL